MQKIKSKIRNKFLLIPPILIVLLLGFMVRLIFSPFGTFSLDQGTFIAWSRRLVNVEFFKFYEIWSDYLPGYLYFLWILGKIKTLVDIPNVLLYKLPAILADVLTGLLIYKIVIKIKKPFAKEGQKWALILSSAYLFNPAILANSTFWGQVDSLTALFSLLALYLLPYSFIFSSLFLAFAALIKPQAAFVAPIILYLMIANKWKIQKIALYIVTSFFIFILGFVPFSPNFYNLLNFIYSRISATLGQYPYTSVNAFNYWGLGGFWKADVKPLLSQAFGFLITAASFFFCLVNQKKNKNIGYLLGSVVFLSGFLFLVRMHERHLLPVFPFLTISVSFLPNLVLPLIVLSLTYVANMIYSHHWVYYNYASIFPDFLIKTFIVLNLVSLAFVFWQIKFGAKSKNVFLTIIRFFNKKSNFKKENFPKIKLSGSQIKLLLALIIALSFALRIFGLGNPKNEYFDEVYHAFTARQLLHNNKMAWEWWNTPPSGFAYEWTHPPLAKLGMWLGMLILGENSFAWRFPGALLGTGCILMVYLIASQLFKDKFLGILSAALFALDGLALTMSRIGMNDIYLLFFILLTIYLFLKQKNFLSALSFGLALASKWSAVWAIPILGIIWLTKKEKFRLSYLWFLILPPLVYLLTYLPMFLSGHSFGIFWGMQKQMWWYHTGLKATHPYTSSWWTWPFLLRPVYLYTSDEVGGMVSRIYNLGNPIVFWFGLFSVILSFIYSYFEKNKKLALVVFSYLIFFVPWGLSPRIMFFYHYLPSVPFLAIASGYILRKNPKFFWPIFALAGLAFVYFYPHWAGIKIPLWLDSSYYWFTSWR